MMKAMVEVTDLKSAGDKQAIDGVSFSVKKARYLEFWAPNGAGKTTTRNDGNTSALSMEGKVVIDGIDVGKHPQRLNT